MGLIQSARLLDLLRTQSSVRVGSHSPRRNTPRAAEAQPETTPAATHRPGLSDLNAGRHDESAFHGELVNASASRTSLVARTAPEDVRHG